MVIVPGFASAAITNIYEIVDNGVGSTVDFFKKLFSLNNGNFFLIFVINHAGGSFLS